MLYENNMKMLLGFAKALVKLMGDNTEIALHDLAKKQIIYIVNGSITDREVGYTLDESLAETIISLADSDGHLVGFGSYNKFGRPLRTSHFVFKDEAGQPYALLCVNQDMTSAKMLRDELNELLNTKSYKDAETMQSSENYIQKLIKQIIFSEIERMKPTPIDSKETKLAVLKALDTKGIFDVKDAVAQVCEQINISQATLYNYLRELRTNEQG